MGRDIVLKEAEYDPCLTMYGAGQADAVCITGMDVLNPSLSRPSVMVLPTSTSFGADALIVDASIKSVKDLKGKKVFGLAKSVSEYTFVRNLELLGEKEKDYQFANMDPGAAAVAMQQKQKGVEAILVWNPFVMETLNKRKDVRVLFDSTKIPNEIIDSVCIAETSLAKPGGKAFAPRGFDADESRLLCRQLNHMVSHRAVRRVVTGRALRSKNDRVVAGSGGTDEVVHRAAVISADSPSSGRRRRRTVAVRPSGV